MAFFFVNPLIVGSVYLGMLVIGTAAKAIKNRHDRAICMVIASLFVAFIAPLFFVCPPGALFCIAFAGILAWVFMPHDKEPVQKPKCAQKPVCDLSEDDVIDVEVISVTTIED